MLYKSATFLLLFELVAVVKTQSRLQLTLWKSWLWCHRSCTPPLWRCPCTALSENHWANHPWCGRLKCQCCFGPGGDLRAWNKREMQWSLGNREKYRFILYILHMYIYLFCTYFVHSRGRSIQAGCGFAVCLWEFSAAEATTGLVLAALTNAVESSCWRAPASHACV